MKVKQFLLILLVFTFFSTSGIVHADSNLEEGVSQLANKISSSMLEKRKQKIAIIDFSDLNGNVTALGQFIAEELTTQLFIIAPGKFEFVERRQILKLEQELALGQMGFIAEKGIKKMGQILGVDAVVTGSMTDLGNTVKINARLIGVESAKVFAVASTEIPKTGMVADLIGRHAEAAQASPVNSTAVKPKAKTLAEVKMPFFQNDIFKITVKSLEKTGNTIRLILLYKNISKKNIKTRILYPGRQYNHVQYLIDENGEKYDLKPDEENILYHMYNVGTTDFPPLLTTKVIFTFTTKGEDGGLIYTAVIDHSILQEYFGTGEPDRFQVILKDIPVSKQ